MQTELNLNKQQAIVVISALVEHGTPAAIELHNTLLKEVKSAHFKEPITIKLDRWQTLIVTRAFAKHSTPATKPLYEDLLSQAIKAQENDLASIMKLVSACLPSDPAILP